MTTEVNQKKFIHFYEEVFNSNVKSIEGFVEKANKLLSMGFSKNDIAFFTNNSFEDKDNPTLNQYLKERWLKKENIFAKYPDLNKDKVLSMIEFPNFDSKKWAIVVLVSALRSIPSNYHNQYEKHFWNNTESRFHFPNEIKEEIREACTLYAHNAEEFERYQTIFDFQKVAKKMLTLIQKDKLPLGQYPENQMTFGQIWRYYFFGDALRGIDNLTVKSQKEIVRRFFAR